MRHGRTVGESINDDAVYEVKTIEVFKGEDGEDYAVNGTMNLTITTGGNSAMCGIYMDIGEQYLIDLTHESGDNLTTVGLCGLFAAWDSLSDENLELLLNGDCVDYDPCDNACGEYQVSQLEVARGHHLYSSVVLLLVLAAVLVVVVVIGYIRLTFHFLLTLLEQTQADFYMLKT